MKKSLVTLAVLIFASLFAGARGDLPVYTGDIYPTPQDITIGGRDIDFARVSVKGMDGTPQRRELETWLRERGVEITPGAAEIKLSISDAAPNKPEGYSVEMSGNTVSINGCDKRGLLWGISSLMQMLRHEDGKILLREFSGTDYPVHPLRGYMYLPMADDDRFMTAFKLNFHVIPYARMVAPIPARGRGFWMKTPPPESWVKAVKERRKLSDLGLGWALGIEGYLGGKEWAVGDDEKFNRLMEYYRPIAEAGGWIEVYFDDIRFPMHGDDVKRFGSGREADIYFINKLYKTIKEINPDSGIIFCPPFYWGPAYDPGKEYGESRDEYLRGIGGRLPKDVKIQWTGKSVWSGKIKKSEVEWISGRLQRKPSMHQNDTGMPHFGTWHYYTDPVEIWQWHYDGIFNDVQHFAASANSPVYVMTMSDYMWNPARYDPVNSPLRACAKLVGRANVPKLDAMNKLMTTLDPYGFKVNFTSVKEADKIAKTVAGLEKVWQDAQKGENGDMFKLWTTWEHKVNFAKSFNHNNQAALKSGKFSAGDVTSIEQAAVRETQYRKGTDIFLSAYDFSGGTPPRLYTFEQKDQRVCTVVRGKGGSNLNMLKTTFKMPAIGGSEYTLKISGQDDDEASNCEITVRVNGNVIFEGANPLKPFVWGIWSLPVRGMYLKEGDNTLEIEVTSENGAFSGGKFFLVNYAVIKIEGNE